MIMRAMLIRGGTSKGLFLRGELELNGLPVNALTRDTLLLQTMGSPDPSGMQLDGVGGGLSSTSKVALISRSSRPGFDVDYNFGQVALREAKIDWSGSCGNLAAGVGLFAKAEGLVSANAKVVKVWQQNLSYAMQIHLDGGPCKDSLVSIAGVPGLSPPLYVEFVDPMMPNIDSVLPTGKAVEKLRGIDATLIACANPTIFVRAADLQLAPDEKWEYGKLADELNALASEGAARMGIKHSASVRVALLSAPCTYSSTAGVTIQRQDVDVLSRITTEGRIHHAHTTTGAINLAVAARIPRTLPNSFLDSSYSGPVRIGHPGGVLAVDADVSQLDGKWRAGSAGLVRTARILFRGTVDVPSRL